LFGADASRGNLWGHHPGVDGSLQMLARTTRFSTLPVEPANRPK
jgi:hypothetical protein